MTDFSRRRFVQVAGAASAATVFGAETAQALIKFLPANYAIFSLGYVRRNVSNMAANDPDLVAYANAVTAMKALPSNDPRNWTKQAAIHQNFCPHNNWFFLPWHRAYLLYFEQICRDLSGRAQFALPYWDWTNNRAIPAPFWSGSLNDTTRQLGAGQSVDSSGAFCGQPIINTIMAYTDFQQFASYSATTQRGVGAGPSTLESSPHNHVHSTILGNMGTYMSPLDPIFWLHHANIDRIWAMWNLHNGNTSDAAWVNFQTAANFVDKNKVSQPFIVKNMRSTYSNNYRYDTQPSRFLFNIADLKYKYYALLTGLHPLATLDHPTTLPGVATNALFLERAAKLVAARSTGDAKPGSVILTLHGVKPPADQRISLRVFINHPNPTAETPITDPHYVGSIAFFGADMPGMPTTLDYNLDITKALAAIGGGKIDGLAAIQPQLIAIGPQGGAQARTAIVAEKFDVGIREAL